MSEQFAFPQDHTPNARPFGGLTKRELFAAMAMQGLLAETEPEEEAYPPDVAAVARAGGSVDVAWHQYIARRAVSYADALLAELAKEAKP